MIPVDILSEVLCLGDIDVEGRLPGASNATMRGVCRFEGLEVTCVYKPRRGERPLWDFPDGSLAHREVATYRLARDIGWDLVPVTVWRAEGPLGPGMCQQWIEADDDEAPVDVRPLGELPAGWHAVAEGDGIDGRPVALVHEDSADLRRLSLLDAVINNADRKGGHILRRPDGGLAGIDHGLTFHEEPKLRTVLWGWAGDPIAEGDLEALARSSRRWVADPDVLAGHLSPREIRSAKARADVLLADRRFPTPDGMWPALPWPAM